MEDKTLADKIHGAAIYTTDVRLAVQEIRSHTVAGTGKVIMISVEEFDKIIGEF